VAVFDHGRLSRVLAPGVLATSLLATGDQLYVGSEDQGVIPVQLAGRRPNPNASQDSQLSEVRQIFASEDALFAVARNGLYRMNLRGFGWQRVLDAGSATLSDRNISALATDGGWPALGRLFRSGSRHTCFRPQPRHPCGRRACILRQPHLSGCQGWHNRRRHRQRLVRFDNAGSEQQVLTRSDGLIADHVTDIASYRDGLALADSRGLTFLDSTGARSMYAFHGR